ncbi:MAG: GNAT family N-acetyltransferase [Herminiimonas sp.]|nr:GNAT family N-acetyltransferase [Herminiimonas sp.]
MSGNQLTVECFRGQIPPFAATELQRLYHNLYASLPKLRVAGQLQQAVSTYVRRVDGVAVAVLLFRLEADQVHVLNEVVALEPEEIRTFTAYIFQEFPAAQVVNFHVIDLGTQRVALPKGLPVQQYHRSEDIVLTLPATVAAYNALLGKATRTYINRYLKKLQRRFPGFACTVYEGDQITCEQIEVLAGLNRERMAGKRKKSSNDATRTAQLFSLARELGFVVVSTIDGRICAGTVNYRVGDDYFMEVIAHDAQYDTYRLGTLCCYLTICKCIERHGLAYHFLWGRYAYKYRLLGTHHDLDQIVLYRSYRQFLLHAHVAVRHALTDCSHSLHHRLLAVARRKHGWTSHVLTRAMGVVRHARHH